MYKHKSSIIKKTELDGGYKTEVTEMNSVEESTEIGEKAQQIKALISRICDLSHYRALDDIDFLIEAIGDKDYPGSPALDVLPSHAGVDTGRREKVKEYIYCLNSWTEGKDVEDAVGEFRVNENLLRTVYIHLGDLDDDKRVLSLCLSDSLDELVSSPEDIVSEISDEEFIYHTYRTILGREPDDDDLVLRLAELERGKTRPEVIREVLECKESNRRMVAEIAESIRRSNES
jgi:hypothetical protein